MKQALTCTKSGYDMSMGPSETEIQIDVAVLLWSASLATLLRFYKQPYWEQEGNAADRARAIEGDIRLESVAEHSWKVADAVLLLADHFPELDRLRCLELALIHDKLELITGDLSPIDDDATGATTHAFNESVASQKALDEYEALNLYLSRLRSTQREFHQRLYAELIDVTTDEARFVCGLDKLAALTYIVQKKDGGLQPRHYDFTVAYSAKCFEYFPPLEPYYKLIVSRLKRA
jgi:5'-deoxynucleotidase YfbR-like HD superfamily hydrolase